MGLDQYAWSLPDCDGLPDIIGQENRPKAWDWGKEDLAYWRKHPNLQGWMEELYFKKKAASGWVPGDKDGGTFGEFNCVAVRLTAEDIDALELAIEGGALPETEGFFFGVSQPEDTATDLKFIEDARAALRNGRAVYYDSWW